MQLYIVSAIAKEKVGSVAKRVKAPFLRRPCDLGSTHTLVAQVIASLDKALYDDYICLVASNKQQIKW